MKKLYTTCTSEDRHNLWKLCEQFIEAMDISCPETVHQSDRVIENAYEFIENICNVVGYTDNE